MKKNTKDEIETKQIDKIVRTAKNIELPDFDKEGALKKVLNKLPYMHVRWYKKPHNLLKIAAIFIIAFVLGVLVNRNHIYKSNEFVEIKVKKGEKIDISLPDGNKIWINSKSTLRYPTYFSGLNKKIFIEGEAYFELSENNTLPLFILAKNTLIQGYNTSFNIKNRPDENDVEITVEEGWVALSNSSWQTREVILEKGQMGYFSETLPLFIEKNNNTNYLAWKTGKLEFNKTPLKVVAQTLSDYYEKPVVIKGKMKYCQFTSSYKMVKLNTIIQDIEKLYKPTIKIQHKKIIINGDDC